MVVDESCMYTVWSKQTFSSLTLSLAFAALAATTSAAGTEYTENEAHQLHNQHQNTDNQSIKNEISILRKHRMILHLNIRLFTESNKRSETILSTLHHLLSTKIQILTNHNIIVMNHRIIRCENSIN